MKIKELKELIENLDDSMEVIMQKDSVAMGNNYSPLAGADSNCIYVPDTTWCGVVYSLDNTAYENCMGDEEWEDLKANQPKALVLFPID